MRQTLTGCLLAASLAVPSLAAGTAAQLTIHVSVHDLSDNFADFYDAANAPAPAPTPVTTPAPPAGAAATPTPTPAPAPVESAADRRWRLFKDHHVFTDQADDASARAALEAAWPRYASSQKAIEEGFDGIKAEWTKVSGTIFDAFYANGDTVEPIRVVAYVGTFDGKVWMKDENGTQHVYVPVEVTPEQRDLPLAMTLARAALPQGANWHMKPRTLADFIVGEGVVAHAVADAAPGHTTAEYLGLTADQLNQVEANRHAEFRTLIAKLESTDPAVIAKYAGPDLAVARYAGWLLVPDMLRASHSRMVDLMHQRQSDLAGYALKRLFAINRAK